jgi:adenosylcobyric acid synthase
MGRVQALEPGASTFVIEQRNDAPCAIADGAVNAAGTVVGTMLHGLFEDARLRRGLIAQLREAGTGTGTGTGSVGGREDQYDRLARVVEGYLDCAQLWALTGLAPRRAFPDAAADEPGGQRG